MLHLFVGEKIEDPRALKQLIKTVCKQYHLPYFTVTPTHEIMTANLIVVEPADDLCYAMNIMIKNRIRHLPVVDNHSMVGVLSMRDVVRTQVTNIRSENHYLKEYITDRYPG